MVLLLFATNVNDDRNIYEQPPETTRRMRTRAIHAGESPDPVNGASAPNLVMSSTYVVDQPLSFSAMASPRMILMCIHDGVIQRYSSLREN